MDEKKIYELMARCCEPAIMLHRPYPLTQAHKGQSFLGGIPKLPDSLVWPRTKSGIPLHFLAQIDCSELPSSNKLLPDSGVLFFFAKIDEDMDWDYEPLHDACRVLFAPNASGTNTLVPADLPKVEGGWSQFERDFLLPDDPNYCIYPQWPVEFYSIDSWPDASVFPGFDFMNNPFREYQAAVDQARIAESDRATGLPPIQERRNEVLWSELLGLASHQDNQEDQLADLENVFPQLWIMVDQVSRSLANWAGEWLSRDYAEKYDLVADFETIRQQAMHWVELAAASSRTQPLLEERLSFKDWLGTLSAHESIHIYSNALNRAAIGVISALQHIAVRPDLVSALPRSYLDRASSRLLPNCSSSNGRNRVSHQMLGNAQSSQRANQLDREEVLLLQLISDPGVNFMFCDMGEAEFWIGKDDLASRCFDRVRATTCGG